MMHMLKPTIIYGPAGFGKTRRKFQLQRLYGATRVVEDWRDDVALAAGDLAITNLAPPFKHAGRAISFYRAKAELERAGLLQGAPEGRA